MRIIYAIYQSAFYSVGLNVGWNSMPKEALRAHSREDLFSCFHPLVGEARQSRSLTEMNQLVKFIKVYREQICLQ